MKEKILEALKTKYKNLGFSDKAFDGVALFLSKTVTEESQVETAISGVETILKSFQGEVDKVRNEKTGLQKELDELKAKQNQNTEQNPNQNPENKGDIAAIIKSAVEEATKPFINDLNNLKTKTEAEKRKERLNLILNDCKDELLKTKIQKDFSRMSFEKEEDFDGYLTETKTDIETVNQRVTDTQLSNGNEPLFGNSATDKEVSPPVKSIIDKRKEN